MRKKRPSPHAYGIMICFRGLLKQVPRALCGASCYNAILYDIVRALCKNGYVIYSEIHTCSIFVIICHELQLTQSYTA